MKLFAINMFVFLASLQAFADVDQPGAFDKISSMYQAAAAPKSAAELYSLLHKLKECAGSFEHSKNTIGKTPTPVKITYTKPAFGPDFPAEVTTGVVLNNSKDKSTTVSDIFFRDYSAELTANGLEVATQTWEDELNCEIVSTCITLRAASSTNATFRITDKYVLFLSTVTKYDDDFDSYTLRSVNYCWQK